MGWDELNCGEARRYDTTASWGAEKYIKHFRSNFSREETTWDI
jgi:hypothetical protein